jgi:ankyrin repeat protein
VIQFVKLNNGIPYDVRCGCVLCNECSPSAACLECTGSCVVCRGLVPPVPKELGVEWKGWRLSSLVRARSAALQGACIMNDATRLRSLIVEVDQLLADGDLVMNEVISIFNSPSLLVEASNRLFFECVDVLLGCRHVARDYTWSRHPANKVITDYDISVEDAIRVIDALEKGGVNFNTSDDAAEEVDTLLTRAIGMAYSNTDKGLAVVERLLRVRDIDIYAKAPLDWATYYGLGSIVKLLLAAPGMDVNRVNGNFSPLGVAIYYGRFEIADMLLAHPDINVKQCPVNWEGYTLVCQVIDTIYQNYLFRTFNAHGQEELLSFLKRLLLVPGIDVNAGAPLVKAIDYEMPSVFELLLTVPGIDITQCDSRRRSVLIASIEWSSTVYICRFFNVPAEWTWTSRAAPLVKLIEESGIDPALLNAPDDLGRTPLYLACLSRNMEAFDFLQVHMPDAFSESIGSVSSQKMSCFHAALLCNFQDVNGTDGTFWLQEVAGPYTFSHKLQNIAKRYLPGNEIRPKRETWSARRGGDRQEFEYWRRRKLNCFRDEKNFWFDHLVTMLEHKPAAHILERLLSLPHADPTTIDDYGSTPFLLACESEDIESVKVFLSSRHGTRLVDLYGAEALMIGLTQSDEMMDVLLEHGCANASIGYQLLQACRTGNGAQDLIESLRLDEAETARLINGNHSTSFVVCYSDIKTDRAPGQLDTTLPFTPPIVMAAARGHKDLVAWFLSIPGVDPNVADYLGDTALIKACEWSYLEIVIMLLRNPLVDHRKLNQFGMTALRTAWDNGSDACIEAFLEWPFTPLTYYQFGFVSSVRADGDDADLTSMNDDTFATDNSFGKLQWFNLRHLRGPRHGPIRTKDHLTIHKFMRGAKLVRIVPFDGIQTDDSDASPPSDPLGRQVANKHPRSARKQPTRRVEEIQGGDPAFHRGPAMVHRVTTKSQEVRRREQNKPRYCGGATNEDR